LAENKYLFQAYRYFLLQALPREDKQQWLESVDSARKAINYVATPTPQLAVMRTFMQNWLPPTHANSKNMSGSQQSTTINTQAIIYNRHTSLARDHQLRQMSVERKN
jgi:hypothetical protein